MGGSECFVARFVSAAAERSPVVKRLVVKLTVGGLVEQTVQPSPETDLCTG